MWVIDSRKCFRVWGGLQSPQWETQTSLFGWWTACVCCVQRFRKTCQSQILPHQWSVFILQGKCIIKKYVLLLLCRYFSVVCFMFRLSLSSVSGRLGKHLISFMSFCNLKKTLQSLHLERRKSRWVRWWRRSSRTWTDRSLYNLYKIICLIIYIISQIKYPKLFLTFLTTY